MTTGVLIAPDRGAENLVDDARQMARVACQAGVEQLWLGQQFDYDAMTLAALLGAANPGVGVGTSVVPSTRDIRFSWPPPHRPRRGKTCSGFAGIRGAADLPRRGSHRPGRDAAADRTD
jgi:hypothetical protein